MLNRLNDVFAPFEQHDVRYLVIGGIAAILYSVPRATFDLDILIDSTQQNAERLLAALTSAGLGTVALTNPAEILANEITVFRHRPAAGSVRKCQNWGSPYDNHTTFFR